LIIILKERGKLPANHGIGIAAYGFMSGGIFNWFDTPYAFSSAIVKVSIDGKVDLFTGACDIGQGSDTTLSMIYRGRTRRKTFRYPDSRG
jgi:CO/xanthine dehydrogenase Mo-binding subunit